MTWAHANEHKRQILYGAMTAPSIKRRTKIILIPFVTQSLWIFIIKETWARSPLFCRFEGNQRHLCVHICVRWNTIQLLFASSYTCVFFQLLFVEYIKTNMPKFSPVNGTKMLMINKIKIDCRMWCPCCCCCCYCCCLNWAPSINWDKVRCKWNALCHCRRLRTSASLQLEICRRYD